jgi:methylated-DNA-protein-cysteine methyltransferase-like protein
VSTYGVIARLAGRPGHARLTGYALHALPDGMEIPWHRVVNARGCISFPEGSRAYHEQARRLRREGVPMNKGRIDLRRHGWPQEDHTIRNTARRGRTG